MVMRDHPSCCLCQQVQDEEGWISFFPGPFANLTFGIDHRLVAPIIGDMWYTWHSDDAHFRCAIKQLLQVPWCHNALAHMCKPLPCSSVLLAMLFRPVLKPVPKF